MSACQYHGLSTRYHYHYINGTHGQHITQHIDIAVKKRELQTVETDLLTYTSIQDERSTSCDPLPPLEDDLVLHTRLSPEGTLGFDPTRMMMQSAGIENGFASQGRVNESPPKSAVCTSSRKAISQQWEQSQRATTLTAASDTRKARPPPIFHEVPADLWDAEGVGYVDLQEGTDHDAARGGTKTSHKKRRSTHKDERTKSSHAPVHPLDRAVKKTVAKPVQQIIHTQTVASHPLGQQHNKMPDGSAAQQDKGKKVFDCRAPKEVSTAPIVQESSSQLHHKPNLLSRKACRGGVSGKHSQTASGRGPVRLEPLRKQPTPPAVAKKKVSPGDWFLEDDTPW